MVLTKKARAPTQACVTFSESPDITPTRANVAGPAFGILIMTLGGTAAKSIRELREQDLSLTGHAGNTGCPRSHSQVKGRKSMSKPGALLFWGRWRGA